MSSIIGSRFGILTVVSRVDDYISPCGQKRVVYRCRCDCGNYIDVKYDSLVHKGRKTKTSCGCMEVRYEDLSGRRFGNLTVLRRGADYINPQGKKYVKYECICDCGNLTSVPRSDLKSGATKSCGCLAVKHGMRGTRLYRIWTEMKSRCSNTKTPQYKYYGANGVTVCDEWSDFEKFYEWAIRNGYDDALSIDRIDVTGDYSPSNCRWATNKEQANNKRNNVVIELWGIKHTLAEWCDTFRINYATVHGRLHRGYDPITSLLSPIGELNYLHLK